MIAAALVLGGILLWKGSGNRIVRHEVVPIGAPAPEGDHELVSTGRSQAARDATITESPGELSKITSRGERHTSVRVTRSTGVPIEGARVLITGDESTLEVAYRTNADGAVEIAWPQSWAFESDRTCIAAEDESQRKELWIAGDPPSRVTLVLRDSGSVSGTVRPSAASTAWVEDAVVVAWPTWFVPTASDMLRAARHGRAGPVLAAIVDPGWFFELSGVERDVPYYLVAATGSELSTPRRVIRAGDVVDLPLRRLYGAELVVREEGGAPLLTTSLLFSEGLSWVMHDDCAERVRPTLPELALTNFRNHPSLEDVALERRDRTVVVYACEQDAPSLGPLEFSHRALGYEPVEAEFFIPPMTEGGLSIFELAAVRRAVEWGALRISFVGSDRSVHSQTEQWAEVPWGRIVLISEDGASDYQLVTRGIDAVESLYLPAGEYRCVLHSLLNSVPGSFFAVGTGDSAIRVSGDRIADVSFDLSGMTAVRIRLVDSRTGGEFLGRAEFRLRTRMVGSDRVALGRIGFGSAPYWIFGLPEGGLSVDLEFPLSDELYPPPLHVLPVLNAVNEYVMEIPGISQ